MAATRKTPGLADAGGAGRRRDRRHAARAGRASTRRTRVVEEIEAKVPHDVVITHDGKLLFAYAAEQATLSAARAAIEGVLGATASTRACASATGTTSSKSGARSIRRRRPRSGSDEPRRTRRGGGRDAHARRQLGQDDPRGIRAEHSRMGRQAGAAVCDRRAPASANDAARVHRHGAEAQDRRVLTGPGAEERATIRTETAVMSSPL